MAVKKQIDGVFKYRGRSGSTNVRSARNYTSAIQVRDNGFPVGDNYLAFNSEPFGPGYFGSKNVSSGLGHDYYCYYFTERRPQIYSDDTRDVLLGHSSA